MSRIHLLIALLAVAVAAGCKAQPAVAPALDPALTRHIEIMVRSQFEVPPDYTVTLGAPAPSNFTGYENLPVTLAKGDRKTQVNFLLSTDGKTLARLETFDLDKDLAFHLDVAGRPIRGNPAAKVTVVGFDDLECPYCGRMHQILFPAAMNRYKDTVRFAYKDFPLVQIHPWAKPAAIAANCLAAQSDAVYWEYVDYIHGHGQEVTGPDRNAAKSEDALKRIAREEASVAKLDGAKLDACLAAKEDAKILASSKEAESLRIEGTPAIFVNGERINGLVSEAALYQVIDRALRAAGIEPPPPPAAPAPPPTAGTK